jgi:hypothetical protein
MSAPQKKDKPKRKYIPNFLDKVKQLQNEESWEQFYRNRGMTEQVDKSRAISLALKKELGFI